MTQLSRVSGAVLAALIVSSCGGEDSPSPTPSPIATATPTPTPTPTPTFSYTEFANLTGVQDFGTACVAYRPRGNNMPGLDGEVLFSGAGAVDLDATTGVWTIAEINGATVRTIGPESITSTTATRVEYNSTATAVPFRLSVITPQVAGQSARYGRAISYLLPLAGGGGQSGFCTLGVATDPDDIPATTTVTYSNVAMEGVVLDEPAGGGQPIVSRVISGSGTITGNTTTGEITFSLTYVVEAPGGVQTTIGPITGTAPIDLGNDSRAGYRNLIGDGTPPQYAVNGAFYGPQGRETGFILYSFQDADSNGLNERVVLIGGYATR
ncbi:hypothetical protein [Erythrobacter sp. EC-HK427]|uniref:hypothetical protein n=1 Tax=Erythrobacter sp. EC-HK427 TaxID=2038396 RepID=UPI00125C47A1|nr:hypothetical protein [Erythrobacter sp. EC-HK427]VVT05664.1 conserved hypothetical protein [Erythrobacter sp. EC-HK427]